MSTWSLSTILTGLHDELEQRLDTARRAFGHSGTKGDASENAWLNLFQIYLPQRYRAERAHVVDSNDGFSEQMDIVVFDRQYSPFIFNFQGQLIVPAESVYAVFEAKQTINAELVRYARGKIASVRALHRTSLPIPHAGGTYPPKELAPILGGILALESEWKPPLGNPLKDALASGANDDTLDFGCIARHGFFVKDKSGYVFSEMAKATAPFLFELIAQLQERGTVPMIDVRAYGRWLTQ